MFIFETNHVPKFLAQFESKIVAPPAFIDRSEGILLMSLEEKSITSVLSAFRFNTCLCIHDTMQHDVGPRLLSHNQLVSTKGTATESRLRKSGDSVHGYDILYRLALCTSCSIWVLTQSLARHYIASALALIAHCQYTQFGSRH